MIPLVNKDTITSRINAEYEYIRRNALPLHDFEQHCRIISILSFKIYALQRANVPLISKDSEW